MDITIQDLQVFCALSFVAGIFLSVWLTRFFEVVHMWIMVKEVLLHLLFMIAGLEEDVEFIKEVKVQHLKEAGYEPEQIRAFQEIDDYSLTQWKQAVIIKLVARVPRRFKSMMPFTTYEEAKRFLNSEIKEISRKD